METVIWARGNPHVPVEKAVEMLAAGDKITVIVHDTAYDYEVRWIDHELFVRRENTDNAWWALDLHRYGTRKIVRRWGEET